MFCCDGQHGGMSRREMLSRASTGFGAMALAALTSDRAYGGMKSPPTGGVLSEFHHPPKARSVIFLYMDGGPSQLDTFDPKPRLEKEHGQPIKLAKVPATQFDNVGTVLKSPCALLSTDNVDFLSASFSHTSRPVSMIWQ